MAILVAVAELPVADVVAVVVVVMPAEVLVTDAMVPRTSTLSSHTFVPSPGFVTTN